MSIPEPWLRGPLSGVDPLVSPVLYAFEQAREDLSHYTSPLSTAQIWATPHGFGSVGFHLRHIARSIDRMTAYLDRRQLSEDHFVALESEHRPGASRDELLAELDQSLRRAEALVRALNPATLSEPREVGRKRLPTTVAGLLTHIAEHTQRHVGQAISAAKLAAVTLSDRP